MRKFPDDQSIETLRLTGVRYIIVHRSGYLGNEYTEILSGLAARTDLVPLGRFRDADDWPTSSPCTEDSLGHP